MERAYDWLTTQYVLPEQTALAADSSGGHLAVDLCRVLLRDRRALPAVQVLFSPLIDLTLGLAREKEKVAPDPLGSAAAARRLIRLYTDGVDPADERLTITLERGEVLPPTLIQVGAREILTADAQHLHQMLTDTGTTCALQVWPNQFHVFQSRPRLIPEASAALGIAGDFINETLSDPLYFDSFDTECQV